MNNLKGNSWWADVAESTKLISLRRDAPAPPPRWNGSEGTCYLASVSPYIAGAGKPGSSPLKITCLWTQQGNWVSIQLQVLQPAASCIIQAKIYFLQIWLTFLFAFISLKHNKLQMIQWGYHNCYGNLELSADLWLKTKMDSLITQPLTKKKKPQTTGFKGTKVNIRQIYMAKISLPKFK